MLKCLELFGFKSFAEKTKFDFSPGITAVVGPNGSGKSNVVDAIKWIMGDQSPKSLRGKEMTDVIFNGATGRKGSNFAEASITFDNASGFLPIDSAEVSIGRRLWRTGDAEYLINGNTSRLKDIRDLLMGTGAGSAAYCIIEQGRVDQILQSNTANRRMILEEAAGVSRFKSRKVEALRKLERVDQNLLRLTDIVDEAESRLNGLRSQASRAAAYREISTELKRAWLGLAADDYRHWSADSERMMAEVAECRQQLADLNAEHQRLESQIAEIDVDVAAVDRQMRETEQASAGNRERIAELSTTIRHQTNRREELHADLTRLRSQRALLASRAGETLQEVAHMEAQLARSQEGHAELKQKLEAQQEEIAQLSQHIESGRQRLEDDRERLLEQMRETSEAGSRVDGHTRQLESLAEAGQSLDAREARLNATIDECRAVFEQRRQALEDSGERLVRKGDDIQEIHQQRRTLLDERQSGQSELTQLKEQRSAWKARQAVLEDFESRQQGIGLGVREILDRAQSSNAAPWNTVLGVVADLLHVEFENAGLLEVALGDRAQLIAVQALEPIIDYVVRSGSNIDGRVGFIAPSTSDRGYASAATKDSLVAADAYPQSAHHIDLQGLPGVVRRADELVHSCDVAGLPSQLLRDTWVVETLAHAVALSQSAGAGCRFVTLQGELLEPEQRLTIGTFQIDAAVLSRKSELQQLKYQLRQIDQQIASENDRLEALSETLGSFETDLDAADSQLQELSEQHADIKSEFIGQQQELGRLLREGEALADERIELAAKQTKVQADLAAAEAYRQKTEQQLEACQNEISELEFDLARSEHRLSGLETERSDGQLKLAKDEERLEGLRTAFERLSRDRETREQQAAEAERRYAGALAKWSDIQLHVLNAGGELAELTLAHEDVSLHMNALFAQKERVQGRRAELLKAESKLRARRGDINDQIHCEEMELRDLENRLETLGKRVEEEYHLTLPEVAESGASAYEDYLDEKHPEWRDGEGATNEEGTRDEEVARGEGPVSSDGEEIDFVDEHDFEDDEERETAGDRFRRDWPEYDDIRDDLEAHADRLRRKLKKMGNVDTESLADLEEMEERYNELREQLEDLLEAKGMLEDIVRRINAESKRMFLETFEEVRGHFQLLFRKAFGGGEGDLILDDPTDVLECGIEIVARPPGKDLKSLSLLSGGEKALTAFALLLALFKTRPSPYCLLDEVDAPLDEANVGRLGALLEEFKDSTQFIIVTHKKPTMTIADVIYGVTMEESGVSKRMSVRFEDVSENGEFLTDGDTAQAA